MSNETVMELGRFEFGKNGRVVLSRSAQPVTYYKRSWWTYTWIACAVSDGEGCAALDRAQLSLDRSPPPLRDPPKPAPSPQVPAAGQAGQPAKTVPTQAARDAERLLKGLRMVESVGAWWNKPFPPPWLSEPPAPVAQPAAKPPAGPVIPPFDIQQIPDAMEKLKLPVSAQMMRHWFAGEANYSTTEDDLRVGMNQNGQPYPPNMIDKSILTLDWVLTFQRARAAYDELLSTAIFKPAALREIKKRLLAYKQCRPDGLASFNGLGASREDIHRLHADFQFQFTSIDATSIDKLLLWLAGDAGTVKAPDDLTGALGTVSIYAALGDVSFKSAAKIARVKSVYVYVRDSYSFRDVDESQSQYLGHWNQDDVYLAPLPAIRRSALAGC